MIITMHQTRFNVTVYSGLNVTTITFNGEDTYSRIVNVLHSSGEIVTANDLIEIIDYISRTDFTASLNLSDFK